MLLFFDEMPWLDTRYSRFLKALSCLERVGFETGQSETDSLWFGNHLDDEYLAGQQGRFAQSCDSLHLSPSVQSGRDGGVPGFKRILDGALPDSRVVYGDRWNTFYLNMLNRSLSVAQNIDELFFSSSAPLRSEYGFLSNRSSRNPRSIEGWWRH